MANSLELALLKDAHRSTATGWGAGERACRFGIYGMGGLGKTVLAADVARRESVRKRFHDGVLWLDVGQSPQLIMLQGQLARAAGADEVFVTPGEGQRRLCELYRHRAVLLVLDDVWERNHLAALDVVGECGRLLVTTRNRKLLGMIGAVEHRLEELPADEALELLRSWAGTGENLEAARAVAERCGRLPLALAMLGGMVREDGVSWSEVLELLEAADLAEMSQLVHDYPYPNMLKAIQVSVEQQDAGVRKRYLDLAVFAEEETIPESALEQLFGVNRLHVRRTIDGFVARSLATRDEDGFVRLHDLQRMYVRCLTPNLATLHGRLLDAYEARYSWSTLAEGVERYFIQRAAYHLVQARRYAELKHLLMDYCWLCTKLRTCGPIAVIVDFDLYMANKLERQLALVLVRDAMRLSSHILEDDPSQLCGQLHGRLVKLAQQMPDISQLLSDAQAHTEYPWGADPLRQRNSLMIWAQLQSVERRAQYFQ